MMRSSVTAGLWLAVWLGWLGAGWLAGQEFGADDPFGIAPAAPAAAAATDDEDPFGTAVGRPTPSAPPAATTPQPAAAAVSETVENDPIVLGVRSTNPVRPRELLWAARTVLQAGRPDEARRYLRLLLDAAPDAAAWAALQARDGSGLFLRLLRDERLQPEGQEVAQAALDAAAQTARDPARLDALIDQLGHADAQQRRQALVDLRQAGESAATALIAALSDKQRQALHPAVVEALAALGSVAEGPLLGVLGAQDPYVRSQGIAALGLQSSRAAIAWLLRPALDPSSPAEVRQAATESLVRIVGASARVDEAQKYLTRQVSEYLAGRTPAPADSEGMVRVWTWDESGRTSTGQSMAAGVASRWTAARLAEDLSALTPDSPESRQLRVLTLLDWAGSAGGLDLTLTTDSPPVRQIAAEAGVPVVERVLASALEQDRVPAAIAALTVLRDVGDIRLLAGGGGQPSTVTRALQHANPEVRFAAAATMLQWNSASPYPGSSYLVETLAFFVQTAGTRRALVGHPRTDVAQNLTGMLHELGFAADTAHNSREVFRLAAASPDYELLLLSDALDVTPIKELVQQLRRDARTAALPVGILTQEDRLEELQRFAETEPLTAAFPRAHSVPALMVHVRRLLELAEHEAITTEQRLMWADAALDYFGVVASDQRHYLFPELLGQQPTLIQTLFVPALAMKAAHVLGQIGSPEAQRALTLVANQRDRSLPQRQAAVAAFAIAVERRGLLLTRREILEQYDHYNRSGRLDRETQQILGAILDAIEAPSKVKP